MACLNHLSCKLINRNIEKALNLSRMHIHCQHAMRSSNGNTISDQAGSDRNTGLIFLVGTAIGIIRDYSSNTSGRSSFKGINHNEYFHDGAIDGRTERLNNKNILPAYILINFDENILIAELKHVSIS